MLKSMLSLGSPVGTARDEADPKFFIFILVTPAILVNDTLFLFAGLASNTLRAPIDFVGPAEINSPLPFAVE
jgi:hypothetical protein